MSAGLKGPPLVRVSSSPLLSSGQENRVNSSAKSIYLAQHQISTSSQPQTPRDVCIDERTLSHELEATSINDNTENDNVNGFSCQQNATAFPSTSDVSSSSGIIAPPSGSFGNIKGPPLPPQTKTSPRYSTEISPSSNCPPPPTKHAAILDNLAPANQYQRQAPMSISQYRSITPPPPPHRTSSSSPSSSPQYRPSPPSIARSGIQPPATTPRRTSRIDSSQMPRPPRPQKDIIFNTRAGVGRKVPPLSGSTFKAIDKGNCSPRLMRVTMCAIPTNKEILNNTGIPFAIVSTPFAGSENLEEPVPIVDMGPSPPR